MTEAPSSRHLGNSYILEEQIGSGTQGEVWRGHAKDSPQPLAFKILHTAIASESSVIDVFLKERSAFKRVSGPNVIEVHDIVVERDTLGLVMDYVDGGSLRDLIGSHGALPPQTVAWLGAQVATGITAVHDAGVVHRDIKPENILIDSSTSPGTPKIADFGVASICDSAAATRTAVGAGTPLYMAPEVNGGARPSSAMDVYSLGIMLYELSCGVTPFNGHYNYVIAAHTLMTPIRPEGIPDPLWDLISTMLEKNPASRPAVSEAQQRLSRLSTTLSGSPAAPTLPASPCTPDTSPLPALQGSPPAPQSPQPPETAETAAALHPPVSPPRLGPPPAYAEHSGHRALAAPPPLHRRSPMVPAIAIAMVGVLAIVIAIGAFAYIHIHLSRDDSEAADSAQQPQQPGPAAPQESTGAPASSGTVTADGKDAAAISFVESLKQADEVAIWRRTTPQSRQQLEDPSPAPGYHTARDYIVRNASGDYNVDACMSGADATAAGIQVSEHQVACRIGLQCQAGCPAPVVVLEAGTDRIDSISFIVP